MDKSRYQIEMHRAVTGKGWLMDAMNDRVIAPRAPLPPSSAHPTPSCGQGACRRRACSNGMTFRLIGYGVPLLISDPPFNPPPSQR